MKTSKTLSVRQSFDGQKSEGGPETAAHAFDDDLSDFRPTATGGTERPCHSRVSNPSTIASNCTSTFVVDITR